MSTLFFSCAHRDEILRDELEIHLSTLKRQGVIEGSGIHGRPWLPSHLSTLTNTIRLQLYMRPVDASTLAGPDGICGVRPDSPKPSGMRMGHSCCLR